jgi:hypothetical protein
MTKTRLAWDRVPPTVLARGGGTCDYYHPDIPMSFTIPEIRRICSFPDDFVLLGNWKQQWERMGRAVPPVMMAHIAAAVRDGVLTKVSTGPTFPPEARDLSAPAISDAPAAAHAPARDLSAHGNFGGERADDLPHPLGRHASTDAMSKSGDAL